MGSSEESLVITIRSFSDEQPRINADQCNEW